MTYARSLLILFSMAIGLNLATADRPDILLITVDDMSCDSVGVFGAELADTTPHIDSLAAQGLQFRYAHVQVGNCMPGRNVMFSGLFSHNNGVLGFNQNKNPHYPHLSDLLQAGGYYTAIFGKVGHSSPYLPYAWDLNLDKEKGEKLHIKDPHSYYRATKRGIQAGRAADKPLFLNVNVSDPHKPFYGVNNKYKVFEDPHKPSKLFTPEEVPIPRFLFDDPAVRLELAHYYMSVRRADDCVGEVLRALEESGRAENTVVMFFSDHGMPLPWAKTALYHHSTHTPWLVRWPGKIEPGTVDEKNMISAVDLPPTLLDIVGLKPTTLFDGRSFLPLLEGKPQEGRNHIIKEYNENVGGGSHPMRGVQTKRFLYLFNPWSDGLNKFKTATTSTLSYRKMREMASTDPAMAKRLHLFDHRVVEELYDVENDPDCLHNLIDDPEYGKKLNQLRGTLEDWMIKSKDTALAAFQNRHRPEVMYGHVAKLQAESDLIQEAKREAKKLAKAD